MRTIRAVPHIHSATDHHHHNMVWQAAVSTLFTASLLAEAHADDNVIGRFTSSLSKVYVATEMCEGTLVYSPADYVASLTKYLTQYYPEGVGYWVLPAANMHINNVDSCVVMLEARLFDYHAASIDFHESYPEEPMPPSLHVVLMAGQGRQSPRQAALSVSADHAAVNKKVVYDGVGP